MHFPKFLAALGLMLGLAAESLARESIYFFNEAGWNGDNLFEKINVGECRAIPAVLSGYVSCPVQIQSMPSPLRRLEEGKIFKKEKKS